jgi:alpha-beta hydrolase superfamily lysophospholipase
MGATITEHFAINYQESLNIKGLVLSGVGTKIRAIKGFRKGLAKFLGTFSPKLRMTVDEAPYLSRDPAVVESYREDPLVSKKPTLKIGIEFANGVSKAKKLVDQIKIPTLVQFGSADNVMLNGEEFAELLTMPDKTIKIYDNCLHEIYNEIEEDRTIALKDLGDWLDKHVA